MTDPSLRDRLLAVDGVAEANVEGAVDNPAGVRVVLADHADAAEVGRQVQRILADHGIRARVGASPQLADGPPPPPGAPAEVVRIRGSSRGSAVAAAQPVPEHPDPQDDQAPVVTGASLESLAVEETSDGVVVTAAAADGRTASRRARWTEGGLNEAVVAAVADLASPEGPPLLLDVVESTIAGTIVVTVVLERVNGRRSAGAAAVEAGAAYAVGKAAWQALTA